MSMTERKPDPDAPPSPMDMDPDMQEGLQEGLEEGLENGIDLGDGPKDTVEMSREDIDREIREREANDADEAVRQIQESGRQKNAEKAAAQRPPPLPKPPTP